MLDYNQDMIVDLFGLDLNLKKAQESSNASVILYMIDSLDTAVSI